MSDESSAAATLNPNQAHSSPHQEGSPFWDRKRQASEWGPNDETSDWWVREKRVGESLSLAPPPENQSKPHACETGKREKVTQPQKEHLLAQEKIRPDWDYPRREFIPSRRAIELRSHSPTLRMLTSQHNGRPYQDREEQEREHESSFVCWGGGTACRRAEQGNQVANLKEQKCKERASQQRNHSSHLPQFVDWAPSTLHFLLPLIPQSSNLWVQRYWKTQTNKRWEESSTDWNPKFEKRTGMSSHAIKKREQILSQREAADHLLISGALSPLNEVEAHLWVQALQLQ